MADMNCFYKNVYQVEIVWTYVINQIEPNMKETAGKNRLIKEKRANTAKRSHIILPDKKNPINSIF